MNEAEDIVALTLSMLAAAQKEDWEKMGQLEEQRRSKLEAYFTSPILLKNSPEFAGAIQRMLAADEVLVSVLEEAMVQISSKVKEISLGRQAIIAYSHQ